MIRRIVWLVLLLAPPAIATEHLVRIGYHEVPAIHVDRDSATPPPFNRSMLLYRYQKELRYAVGPGVMYLMMDSRPENTILRGVTGPIIPGGGPHWQYGVFYDYQGAHNIGSPFAGGNTLHIGAAIGLYESFGDGVQQIALQFDLQHRSFVGPSISVVVQIYDSRAGYVPPDHIGHDTFIPFISGSILGGRYTTRWKGDHYNAAWGPPEQFATRVLYSQAQHIIGDMGLAYLGPPEEWLLTRAFVSGERASHSAQLATQGGGMHVAVQNLDIWSVGPGR